MLRNLARRGASVLIAAAVLGGGLALGGGTASAEEVPNSGLALGIGTGSAEDVPLLRDVNTASAEATGSVFITAGMLMDAWINNGLIDTGTVKFGCDANTIDCPI
ncbi:hypothetical protein [Rhodococcus sp. MTM3W5.2]|uniref:hypothetical protein n=1 Tax=Rhodococcus sp. MTM3W5.2 TaxID=1805827 RepID=UPI00097BE15F|nr:hypothetical protein [Rhodococcus sp. MTM3W5.2]